MEPNLKKQLSEQNKKIKPGECLKVGTTSYLSLKHLIYFPLDVLLQSREN